MANGSTFSVVGTDVKIRGDVEATADLHVDGSINGDIVCASLVQGEASLIEGSIRAETARLSGTVKGTITAQELIILKSARVEGDVHYKALTIEHGATVDGRFAPDAGKQAAKPALAPPANAKAAPLDLTTEQRPAVAN